MLFIEDPVDLLIPVNVDHGEEVNRVLGEQLQRFVVVVDVALEKAEHSEHS